MQEVRIASTVGCLLYSLIWSSMVLARFCRGGNSQCRTCPRLTSRRDMQFHRALWQHLLEQILDDLNEFFGTGALAVPSLEVTLGETLITDLVAKLYPADALELSSACVADADFDAQVNGWWIINSVEHADADKCSALAQVNIIYWINRLLFGHYLKHFNRVALRIDEIRRGISPE